MGRLSAALTTVLIAWSAVAWVGSGTSTAATTTVAATVASATLLDATGCPGDTPNRTSFTLAVNTSLASTTPCSLLAGSSNSALSLRLFQTDGSGVAMFASTTGQLQTTGFGTGGIALATVLSGQARGLGAAVQPDGAVVVAGRASNGTNTDVAVARFLPDGTLDPAFDGDSGTGNGVVTTDVNGNDTAAGVAIDSLGRIVIAGTTNPGAPNSLVIRYLSDGRLDTGFNGTGKREEDLGAQDGYQAVAVRPDNKIVVGGFNGGYVNNIVDVLNEDGTHWNGFAGGGRIQVRAPGGSFEQVRSVLPLPDGSIIAAGRRESPGPQAFLAFKAKADGTGVETTWGTSGFTLVSFAAGNAIANAVVRDAAGGFVLIGHDPNDFAVARLDASGLLDTGWGSGGKRTMNIAGTGEVAYAGVLESDGSIAVVGGSAGGDFALSRVSRSGAIDPRFGTAQGTTVNVGGTDAAQAVAVLPDGHLYVAGHDGTRLALARLRGTPFAGYAAATNGFTTGPTTSGFGACLDAVSGAGATPTWTPAAGCPLTDVGHWNPIPPTTGTAGATVASRSTVGGADIGIDVRFGLHTSNTQLAGLYVAPVTFEVVAP